MPKVTQIFFSIFLKLVFLYVFLCLWYTFCPISVFIFVEITKDFTQFSLISEASRCSWTIGHLPNSTQNLKTLPIGPWSWLMPKKGTCRQGTLDDFIFTSKYDLRSSIFSFDWKCNLTSILIYYSNLHVFLGHCLWNELISSAWWWGISI